VINGGNTYGTGVENVLEFFFYILIFIYKY